MSLSKQLRIAHLSPALWRVTFDNPPINLLNPDTIGELRDLIAAMESETQLKVVVFDSANPDYFIAHYDIARAGEPMPPPGPTGLPPWTDFTVRLAETPVVSIAAIRGRARGVGNEFLLACDLRFASLERAIFGQPEVAVGVVPGGGAVDRLPLLLGRARALELLLGGDDLDAATAERYGLVNRALPDKDLDRFVDRLATRIASFDKPALATVKALVNRHSLPAPGDLLAATEAFRQSLAWEGVGRRVASLLARGLSKPGEFELNLGEHVGTP